MSMLFRITYAAHAKGTHHKLALDALRHMRCPAAEGWQRVFLKHADLYMQGAKAPDDEFKDFKNHVLHVRDGYWGGAPDKVEAWYGHLVEALKQQQWSEAVWAAGVLSHYYTDPIQPFHTQQSEAENSIHRAAEWSISKSYDALKKQGEAEHGNLVVMATQDPTWLRDLVCAGADKSNQHYEKLIAHYDLNKGVVDPPSGLDQFSRTVLAELIVYAAKGYALVLDRAVADAAVSPPDVELTLETILAAIKIPVKMLAKRIADAEDRRVVEAMYDELKATGRVEATLPEDDRVVRNLYEREVAAPARKRLAEARAAVVAKPAAPAPKSAKATRSAKAPPAPAVAEMPAVEPPSAPRHETPPAPRAEPARVPRPSAKRTFLAAKDDVERAPSIGPKLADRLATAGIRTVADLLDADPEKVALDLAHRHITAETVTDWQHQSRLMMEIPGLRGGEAQLLVGSGFRTKDHIAEADADTICTALLAYAVTAAGQRALRDGTPPDIEEVRQWLEAAKVADAA